MNAGRGEIAVAAGGPARHIPVLLAEALEALNVEQAASISTAPSAPAAIRAPCSSAARG